jgi:hypothetical protein
MRIQSFLTAAAINLKRLAITLLALLRLVQQFLGANSQSTLRLVTLNGCDRGLNRRCSRTHSRFFNNPT